jgi:hypothetical protein
MIGIILLAYLLITAGVLALAGGGAAYYLDKDYSRELLLAGSGLLIAGLGLLVYFMAGF